ncbi:hypothetical protein LWF01_16665 [Saxibacter everestensis]|uniref:Uncharacterized protein n=1 Tax=Saxibacter everestensis TaxID=2909229 RepID=A0ABY8QU45_9MICO|nr:hypothetical protein LWF01_16665 [Brevibacteriaceae bacterium ZFBP1038]
MSVFGKFKERREEHSREARGPVAAWAREQGWYVADPPDATIQYPSQVLAPQLHPKVCNLVVGDLAQQGFTAQSWEADAPNIGGFAFNGRWHVLVTAARENLPRMAAVAKDEIGMATTAVPRDLGGGPLVKSGELSHFGGDPEALQRLAPLGPTLAATRMWLVLAPGSVSIHGPGEPDLDELQQRLQLTRDVAAAFGAQLD